MAVSVNTSITADSGGQSTNAPQANLELFLQPDFDPAFYLNNALPSLSASSSIRTAQSTQNARSVPLPELSSQLQNLLSQLNAQTSRMSSTLAQLTDEIVRSGGRLAYEVDVLRGETIGLTDSLQGALRSDIELFTSAPAQSVTAEANRNGLAIEGVPTAEQSSGDEPDYLDRLKTLASVRARLDAVVQVFGEAMEWPLAPSELSMASSLISVAGPDAGEDGRSREEKGKAYAEQKRHELAEMMGSGGDAADLEAAATAVQEMRHLAEVWKGTSEEKARLKFVDSLQKLVDEKQKALGRSVASSRPPNLSGRTMDYRYGDLSSSRTSSDAPLGFLQNLRIS